MKMRIWLLTLLLVSSLFADDASPFDLTTLSGKKYLGVTVTRVEGDAIAISHADGIARVSFVDLPPELRTKYGYDPNKAAATIAQNAEAMARQRVIDAKNMEAEKQLRDAPFIAAAREQAVKKAADDERRKNAVKPYSSDMGTLYSETVSRSAFSLKGQIVALRILKVESREISTTETEVDFGNGVYAVLPMKTASELVRVAYPLTVVYIAVKEKQERGKTLVTVYGNHVETFIGGRQTFSLIDKADAPQ